MSGQRGPRQDQWNISARAGDKDQVGAWVRRCQALGLVPGGNRGTMPAIRLALELTEQFTDDQLADLLDRPGERRTG
jgi:hypothetical protein